jgi:dephospho-CoA kinase
MIIGITGTDGAGKGTVVDYLVEQKGYVHYSARAYIANEIEKRGLEVTREQLRLVGNDLRRLHGNDHIIREALQEAQRKGETNVIVESIRETDAAKLIKEVGVLLAVDADQKVRYERIVKRASSSDHVTFDDFVAHEALEMDDPDPHGMQKAKVMEMADYTLFNNGTPEELFAQVEAFLQKSAQ